MRTFSTGNEPRASGFNQLTWSYIARELLRQIQKDKANNSLKQALANDQVPKRTVTINGIAAVLFDPNSLTHIMRHTCLAATINLTCFHSHLALVLDVLQSKTSESE
ncbi:hypothetical protein RRG08_046356 [Elysia crispata]|uniref:Uncharacterized protein n=1 Tax=Elysia crispata TaxID=231223 RepID=A0AAE1A4Z7_9GAST|nr:hypothetical protein RRG08_046356 [Elysia crispata]